MFRLVETLLGQIWERVRLDYTLYTLVKLEIADNMDN